jgi:glycosyltransferase involved in cell wall biosynthesis
VATAVSEIDAERFRVLYGRRPKLLPNGVDLDWLREAPQAAVEAVREKYALPPQTVLFMGGYGYRPNGEAIDFLVRNVFPKLLRRAPSARLLVLGGDVPYAKPWLVAPGIVPIEQLPAFMHAAAVSVAPIFSGSGTRLKVIESLAAGVPVVATGKGVEGLPLQPGKDFDRAETAEEFVDALAAILATPRMQRTYCDVVVQLSWPLVVARTRVSLRVLLQLYGLNTVFIFTGPSAPAFRAPRVFWRLSA